MLKLKKTNPKLLAPSPRSNETRLSQQITLLSSQKIKSSPSGIAILGHPDDLGIRLNYGRLGSRQAPLEVRKHLFKMTPVKMTLPIYDIGDLQFKNQTSIEKRQVEGLKITQEIASQNHKLIAIGGGHDHAFSDIEPLLKQNPNLIVFNIDAHFDLRKVIKSPNSGTPFYQLLERHDFKLVEIGIQKSCNQHALYEYAKKKNVDVYEFSYGPYYFSEIFKKYLKLNSDTKPKIFLSLDFDAFSSAYGSGTSAASPVGLNPLELLELLPWINQNFEVIGLGLYEISPPLDKSGMTEKLGAHFIYKFLDSLS